MLIQSAKQDKSTEDLKLTSDEFKDLIFSKDEYMQVNLKQLKSSSGQAIKIVDDENAGALTAEQSVENKLKYFMQKSLKNVTNDLFRIDDKRTYTVDLNDVLKVVNKRV